MIELSSEVLQVVSLLVAFVIPTLVALVTKRYAASAVKTLALIVLAAVLAVLTEALNAGGFEVVPAVLLFAQNVVVAISSHYGITKPLGLSGSDSVVARAVPQGVGQHRA